MPPPSRICTQAMCFLCMETKGREAPDTGGGRQTLTLSHGRSALAATNMGSVGVFCTRPPLRKQVTWEPWAQPVQEAARSAQLHRTPQLALVTMLPLSSRGLVRVVGTQGDSY